MRSAVATRRRRRQRKRKVTRRSRRLAVKRSTQPQPQKQSGGSDSPPGILFRFTPGAGFFSTFFYLCNSYLLAKDKGVPHYFQMDGWQYTFKDGWHDYFTSLTKAPEGMNKDNSESYQHGVDIGEKTYPIQRYIEVIQEIYKPKKEILEKAEAFKASIGGPYSSLYIRRGDKVEGAGAEMPLISTEDILKMTDLKDDGRRIFVQTDDYTIVEEVKKLLPSCKIHTLTKPELRGTTIFQIRELSPEQKKAHLEEVIQGIHVLLGGETIWTDQRSNVGRFHKLSNFDKVRVYPPLEGLTREKRVGPYSSL